MSNGNDDIVVTVVDNYIGGAFVPPVVIVVADVDAPSSANISDYLDVTNPSTGHVIGRVALSSPHDVDYAVQAASDALASWSNHWTIKARAAIMLKFHALIQLHAQELAELIVKENGKNITEALAEVAKGNETVEYACSLPQLAAGRTLQVSSGVTCHDQRRPLGVVASIVPFNFPFMVPFWTIPIALVMGNCIILKPSEKVPLTMHRVAQLLTQAGVPPGVFGMVQGTQQVVQALIQHPDVQAITFVGSSPVAHIVASSCRQLHKKCTALGGAKNHLVALPDCEAETAANDICVSFAGCAGQRCMAASVLLVVGQQDELLQHLLAKAKAIQPGSGPGEMGPVIDAASHAKILSYIQLAEADGAQVLLDGRRGWKNKESGNWIGPTILLHAQSTDRTICEEVFGPVLSVYQCSSWEEAISIENANPFGNAASIYTTHGAHAEWFIHRFRAGMLGVNVGIPVPREPFSFGGLYGTKSKYGDMDITGDGGMEFFSNRIKITSKFPLKRKAESMAGANGGTTDRANFAGSM